MDAFLDSVLRGLITYSTGIFIILGLGILIFLRKFILGLHEWQLSVFGLERRIAQRKLTSASTGLILLILLFVGEFMLITVIGPQLPTQSVGVTPILDLDNNATETDVEEEEEAIGLELQNAVEQDVLLSECLEDVLEITFPEDGEEVSGTVEIIGSVNIENFGSYKYEFTTTGTVNWTTIAAGNQLKLDESLGFWYTSSLPPGMYYLQLVPLNNAGDELTPCVISVRVVSEE